MRDIVERFRYWFELWRRERREDLFGVPRTDDDSETRKACVSGYFGFSLASTFVQTDSKNEGNDRPNT